MYIDDCVEGLIRIMNSEIREPLNLGTDRLVTISELVEVVAKIASKNIVQKYDLSKPQGVRGRNSDNTKLRELLDWEPQIPLEVALRDTYMWIESALSKNPGE